MACYVNPLWTYTLYFDGASRGPNRKGSVGVVIRDPRRRVVMKLAVYLGVGFTNNMTEYKALIMGLNIAKRAGIRQLLIKGDSQLVLNQLNGTYSVRNSILRMYHRAAMTLLDEFERISLQLVPRFWNQFADSLANYAFEEDLFFNCGPSPDIVVDDETGPGHLWGFLLEHAFYGRRWLLWVMRNIAETHLPLLSWTHRLIRRHILRTPLAMYAGGMGHNLMHLV